MAHWVNSTPLLVDTAGPIWYTNTTRRYDESSLAVTEAVPRHTLLLVFPAWAFVRPASFLPLAAAAEPD